MLKKMAWAGMSAIAISVCSRSAHGEGVLDLLIGDPWVCVATEAAGKKQTEEDGQRWTFTKTKIIWIDEDGKHEVEYRIDETATPMALDWWDPEPDGKWHGRCIFRCDGTTLQVCGRVGLKREKLMRPKEFATKGGDTLLLRMVYFTRVK
jgi:uncharacterized protein (TIGR03067 family)